MYAMRVTSMPNDLEIARRIRGERALIAIATVPPPRCLLATRVNHANT